jgi:hypothetical protein
VAVRDGSQETIDRRTRAAVICIELRAQADLLAELLGKLEAGLDEVWGLPDVVCDQV